MSAINCAKGEVRPSSRVTYWAINYAQYERKQTSERIAANWLSRSKRGLWNGGTIPLGYDRNPKNKAELAINESEALIVKNIFKTFLETETVRQTQKILTELGIYNKNYINKHGIEKGGKGFSVGTLQSLLTNKSYIGIKFFRSARTVWVRVLLEVVPRAGIEPARPC
ncbi:MAG: recombinase family protein [Bdellovibrionaceae bacterium]|nr:recombinase family protein [Pseudobdellovibrionaceae bacterium]